MGPPAVIPHVRRKRQLQDQALAAKDNLRAWLPTHATGEDATSILSESGHTSLLTADFQSVPGRILAAIEAMA